MFKEIRGLEYALEVLRAFHKNGGKHDSKVIYDLIMQNGRIDASQTYVQKILPRMVKSDLLISSESGYSMPRPVDEITMADVLDMCDMPPSDTPLHKLCVELKAAVSLSSINEFYDFS